MKACLVCKQLNIPREPHEPTQAANQCSNLQCQLSTRRSAHWAMITSAHSCNARSQGATAAVSVLLGCRLHLYLSVFKARSVYFAAAARSPSRRYRKDRFVAAAALRAGSFRSKVLYTAAAWSTCFRVRCLLALTSSTCTSDEHQQLLLACCHQLPQHLMTATQQPATTADAQLQLNKELARHGQLLITATANKNLTIRDALRKGLPTGEP